MTTTQKTKHKSNSVAQFTSPHTITTLSLNAPITKQNIGMSSSVLKSAIQILKKNKNRITLSITSNVVSSGLRELLIEIVPFLRCIVATTGAIEEDVIKSGVDFTYVGYYENKSDKKKEENQNNNNFNNYNDFNGNELRCNGFNRIGNILVHNDSYIAFEKYVIQKLRNKKGIFSTNEICRILAPEKSILEDIKEEDCEYKYKKVESKAEKKVEKKVEKELENNSYENNSYDKNSYDKNSYDKNSLDKEQSIQTKQSIQSNNSFLKVAKSHNIPIFISAFGDGSIGDIAFFNTLNIKINALQEFKSFIKESKDSIGLCLGEGVNLCKMRYLEENVVLSNRDRRDGCDHEMEGGVRVVGDLSLMVPVVLREVFGVE